MKWFFSRLSEPSSAAGISGIASGILAVMQGQWEIAVPAILGGIYAFMKPEGRNV